MKVSVIIPTYNRCALVQQAVDSVYAQTFTDYELIVIDDGSEDGTGTVLRERYGDKLRYVWQKNQGESEARNLGLDLSRGEYIAFLDSDDLWKETKLDKQVSKLEAEQGNVALVYSSVINIDEEGVAKSSKVVGRTNGRERQKIDQLMWPGIYAPLSNVLVRKSCVMEVGGFDHSITYGEDWLFISELAARWEFRYIDEPLVCYRQYAGNQQSGATLENINQVLADGLYVVGKIGRHTNNGQLINMAKYYLYEHAAFTCFISGHAREGANYIKKAEEWKCDRVRDGNSISNAINKYCSRWILKAGIQHSRQIHGVIFRKVRFIVDNWPYELPHANKVVDNAVGLIYSELLYKCDTLVYRKKLSMKFRRLYYSHGTGGMVGELGKRVGSLIRVRRTKRDTAE